MIGGLTGVMVASVPFDTQVHDTYFVVAHFHYVLIGGAVFPLLGAIYYWFPKITGRMMSERLGRWAFWLIFVGFNLTFFPMHHPRAGGHAAARLHLSARDGAGARLNLFVSLSAVRRSPPGSWLFFIDRRFAARGVGQPAGDNPWDAPTLEWATASPPPAYNFADDPGRHEREPAVGRAATLCRSPTGLRLDRRELVVTTLATRGRRRARVLAAELDLAVLDGDRHQHHADLVDLFALGGGLGLDSRSRSR